MTLYRALSNLEAGKGVIIPKGSVITGERLGETVALKLERLGRLSRVAAPPLAVLPGWSARAKKLERSGLVDAEQFIGMDTARLAQWLGVKAPKIEEWKSELLEFLKAPDPEKG